VGRPLAVLALAGALLAGAGLALGSAEEPAPPAPVQVDAASLASGDLPALTRALEDRVRRLPGDWQAWASLGSVHLQRAAATADPGWYARAEQAFERSLEERPDGNDAALVGLGALAASRHDFAAARDLAEQALAVNAFSSSALGVLTDALTELGEDDAAVSALQRMLDLRPGVPSYTRASYARELRGDLDGAREALEVSLRTANDPADAAFAHRYLGELALNQGDVDEADRQFAAGLARSPDAAALLAGRARVATARGDTDTALALWSDVVARLPEPGYLAELGDLYASLGRTREAEQQYDVVRATEQLLRAAGSDVDLEHALFAADHGDPAGALAAAERIWQGRRSVHAADAYAWALHANGRSQEARELAAQAQRLGTRSALFAYHRGMIELAVGDREAARASLTSALEIDPHFSVLHAPRARAALAGL
jgi:tetratricopeptide (TPR) repeat protein